jgi:two-component system, OmpR family, response regulator
VIASPNSSIHSVSCKPFRSVLFVDDDADICSVVLATLGLVPGLDVQAADSGEKAIDLAYELRPDLVLMDVMMPGLDGPSTFQRMRESALLAHVPVIFMTAKVLPAEIAQFLQLGAIGVIVKPFDPLMLYSDMLGLWSNGSATPPLSPASSERSSARPSVQAQIDSLTINFLRRASADVINLTKMIQSARDGDRSIFKAIERVSHSIHGAGAMFGFPEISEVSGTMACAVRPLAETELAFRICDSAILVGLQESCARLARVVNAAWQTAPHATGMFRGAFAAK